VTVSSQPQSFSTNVFINCPFDSDYDALLRALLFTVLPRIASERFDSGEQRLRKICELIQESRLSIHDLSRMRAAKKNEVYRLNMPFELGIDIGCRLFKKGGAEGKICLVLESERYGYQKSISDLSGVDIKEHANDPENLVRQVRNWFVTNELCPAPSATRIWEDFNEFMADFYEERKRDRYKEEDLRGMPNPEFIKFVNEWLSQRPDLKR